MKQYLDKQQTTKLIELGFEKPKGVCLSNTADIMPICRYSLGELIEILPREINNNTLPGIFGIYIDHNKM